MVAEKEKYKHIFENPSTMSSICEKVIIPNMEFRGKHHFYRKVKIELLYSVNLVTKIL